MQKIVLLATALITWMALESASSAEPIPPSSGRLLWLAADRNISTSGSTVIGWNDAGTNIARFSSSVGNPTLGVASFPNGSHAAVLFDGASGIVLNDAGDLSQQDLSIYVPLRVTRAFSNPVNEYGPFGFRVAPEPGRNLLLVAGVLGVFGLAGWRRARA